MHKINSKFRRIVGVRKFYRSFSEGNRNGMEAQCSGEVVSTSKSGLDLSNDNLERKGPSSIASSDYGSIFIEFTSSRPVSEQSSVYTIDSQDSKWTLEGPLAPCPSSSPAINPGVAYSYLDASIRSDVSDSSFSFSGGSPPRSIHNQSILQYRPVEATTIASLEHEAATVEAVSEYSSTSLYSQDDNWDNSYYTNPRINSEYDPTLPLDAWNQYLQHVSSTREREKKSRLSPTTTMPRPINWEATRTKEGPLIPVPCQPPSSSALKPKPAKTVEEVAMRWEMMQSPFPAHLHNYFCPFWRHGDRRGFARPECSKDETFNLFHVNPFTKSGRAHGEWLRRRDIVERTRRDGARERHEEVSGTLAVVSKTWSR